MRHHDRRLAALLERGHIARVGRRGVLRGAGATLALPFLEVFSRPARAQKAPAARLIVCYTGGAMGGDGDSGQTTFVPARTGRLVDQALPLSLHPLGGLTTWAGTYVSGSGQTVKEPIHGACAATTPDVRSWSRSSRGCASARPEWRRPRRSSTVARCRRRCRGRAGPARAPAATAKTADVIADRVLSQGRRVVRALVQARNYGNGGALDMYMSWRRETSGMQPNAAQVSPSNLFDALVGGYDPTQANQGKDAAQKLRRRRLFTLDLVMPARDRLVAQLGAEDRQRLARHFDLLSDLRGRVQQLDQQLMGCAPPTSPGADPPLGGQGSPRPGGGQNFADGEGYSGELRRAEAFADLLAFAISCDLTRVATLQYLYTQPFMNAMPIAGFRSDIHQASHFNAIANGRRNDAVGLCHHFSVRSFAYLVGKLANVEDEGGRSALESTAMVLTYEAGHGPGSHSGENMACLVAGGAGRLVQGEHIRLAGEHPARVIATLLGCVGLPPKLGELTGPIPEMVRA